VDEFFASGDITGSFQAGLDLNDNVVDDAELVNTLSYTGALSLTQALQANGGINRTSGDLALTTTTSGNITLTPSSATALVNVLTGNLKVGNGTPDVTLNGEDAYIEGTLEVDGASRFDGAVTATGAVTLGDNGDSVTINSNTW